MLLFFYLLLVATVGIVVLDNFRLKDVSIDNEALYASTIFKEVKIPFNAIEEVRLRRCSKRELMVVHVKLRSRCDFGREILFEPDEERNYRAIMPDHEGSNTEIDIGLIQAITKELDATFNH